MLSALFISCFLHLPPTIKHEAKIVTIRQVEYIEQPDLIKWNLQYFYDAMQRDDRNDMLKFAERSIQLLNTNEKYAKWLKKNNKKEYDKLTNLKKIIPPPLEIKYTQEAIKSKRSNIPKQSVYVPSKKYKVPGQQIPIRRDNLPGNRHPFRTPRK